MARGDATQANAALADLIFMEGLPMRLVQSNYLQRFIDVASKVSGYKLNSGTTTALVPAAATSPRTTCLT
jgi:hypothetical protein